MYYTQGSAVASSPSRKLPDGPPMGVCGLDWGAGGRGSFNLKCDPPKYTCRTDISRAGGCLCIWDIRNPILFSPSFSFFFSVCVRSFGVLLRIARGCISIRYVYSCGHLPPIEGLLGRRGLERPPPHEAGVVTQGPGSMVGGSSKRNTDVAERCLESHPDHPGGPERLRCHELL